MRTIYNFYFLLLLFFVFLIPIRVVAQNNFPPIFNKQIPLEKELSSFPETAKSQIIIEKVNPKETIPVLKINLPALNKATSTNLLLEKVVCKADQNTWVDSFTYNGSKKKLTHLIKYKSDSETKWTNEQRFTYTYDDNDRCLSELNEYWYWNKGAWQNLLLNTYAYDEHGNITVRSNESWDRFNDQWNVNVRTLYKYDENNNPITAVSKAWYPDLNQLLPFERQTYTYDSNNRILKILTEVYFIESETWSNDEKKTYVYDNNGNLIGDLTEQWNAIDNDWINKKRITYKYDANNNMLNKIIEKWENYLSEWKYYHKYTYTYDKNNNLKTDLFEYWDDSEGELINIERNSYSYNENNVLTSKINDYWDNNHWMSNLKYSYIYDENSRLRINLEEIWKTDKWENYHRLTYTYDTEGNITNFTSGNWNSLDSSWYNYPDNCDIENNGDKYRFLCGELTAYYTSHLTSVNTDSKILSEFSLSQNYPNPFNPVTTISYSIPLKTNVKIVIYNTLGETITTLINKEQKRGKHKIRFNASRLPSGIYFYKLTTKDYSNTKKMILIK